MSTINFAPTSGFTVGPDTVCGIVEAWCVLGNASTQKDFELKSETPIIVDAVSGTLSFFGMNWSWVKRLKGFFGSGGGQSTALCGTIGSTKSALLAFDFQGLGSTPINIPVHASFPGGVLLDKVHFDMYPDMALPTNFRAALSFNRKL
jgi:hypothetical protein